MSPLLTEQPFPDSVWTRTTYEKAVIPLDRNGGGINSSDQIKEVLDILLESDLYLELPLQERHALFRHIVNAYLSSAPPASGSS